MSNSLRYILNMYAHGDTRVCIPITYRTYGTDGEELLAGFCRYENGEIIPCDGDSYSLDDQIIKYSMDLDDDENGNMKMQLTVWYESEWITDDAYQ